MTNLELCENCGKSLNFHSTSDAIWCPDAHKYSKKVREECPEIMQWRPEIPECSGYQVCIRSTAEILAKAVQHTGAALRASVPDLPKSVVHTDMASASTSEHLEANDVYAQVPDKRWLSTKFLPPVSCIGPMESRRCVNCGQFQGLHNANEGFCPDVRVRMRVKAIFSPLQAVPAFPQELFQAQERQRQRALTYNGVQIFPEQGLASGQVYEEMFTEQELQALQAEHDRHAKQPAVAPDGPLQRVWALPNAWGRGPWFNGSE